VPVEIRIVDGTAVITAIDGDAFVTRAGVQPGQTLVDIDGHDTASLIAAAVGADARAKNLDACGASTAPCTARPVRSSGSAFEAPTAGARPCRSPA